MASFPSSFKSVFGGRAGAAIAGSHSFGRSWPLFRPAQPRRAPRPPAEVARLVESEIIPRLMDAHRAVLSAPDAARDEDDEADIEVVTESTEAFARMVLSNEPDALIAYVGTLLQAGATNETIYVDRLRPAARRLGELWDDDRVSFTDVAVGLSRLQRVVRALGWETPYNGDDDPQSPSALFCPYPGEQHTFGFYIVEEYFRWSGWRTWTETSSTSEELVSNVHDSRFNMVCLSVCQEASIDHLAAFIRSIRQASRHRELFVMVSGGPFCDHPEHVENIGADASASSGAEALHIADKAVRRLAVA